MEITPWIIVLIVLASVSAVIAIVSLLVCWWKLGHRKAAFAPPVLAYPAPGTYPPPLEINLHMVSALYAEILVRVIRRDLNSPNGMNFDEQLGFSLYRDPVYLDDPGEYAVSAYAVDSLEEEKMRSEIAEFIFVVKGSLPAPAILPARGSVTDRTLVHILTPTALRGASQILYSLDGSYPAASYAGPFPPPAPDLGRVSKAITIQAIAVRGSECSAVRKVHLSVLRAKSSIFSASMPAPTALFTCHGTTISFSHPRRNVKVFYFLRSLEEMRMARAPNAVMPKNAGVMVQPDTRIEINEEVGEIVAWAAMTDPLNPARKIHSPHIRYDVSRNAAPDDPGQIVGTDLAAPTINVACLDLTVDFPEIPHPYLLLYTLNGAPPSLEEEEANSTMQYLHCQPLHLSRAEYKDCHLVARFFEIDPVTGDALFGRSFEREFHFTPDAIEE